MSSDLILDRDVRDWVLVPLTVSIFLMMLIRQYATQVTLIVSKIQRKSLGSGVTNAQFYVSTGCFVLMLPRCTL
jgi:hypothetical protein